MWATHVCTLPLPQLHWFTKLRFVRNSLLGNKLEVHYSVSLVFLEKSTVQKINSPFLLRLTYPELRMFTEWCQENRSTDNTSVSPTLCGATTFCCRVGQMLDRPSETSEIGILARGAYCPSDNTQNTCTRVFKTLNFKQQWTVKPER